MASTYEYIISLQDKASGTMQRIVGASSVTVSKLTALSDKAKKLQRVTGDLSGSMFQLKQRIDLLQQEKELLDPSNLNLIKQYNQEIDRLSGRIEKLDNAGRGGKLKGYLGEIGSMVKGFVNPVTMGAAAIGFAGKSAMNFREGMAKVNITAQLDEKGLSDLESKIKGIAKANKFDIGVAPGAFEQIISQTADVDMSLDVLDAALKGSKGGFTDLSTVAGALAQTMSILGGSASSLEVLDTFFAAKRVGAGEFKDFATYMPGLIASADALGVKYKSVAGVFAYMTGKGQDAARASVLMGNMFSSLSKSDITKNLDKAGVKIFDAQGKMRDFVDIFRDLGGVMSGMSDQQKTAFLEKVGIVDKEAKAAFAIMGSDLDKLTESMRATAKATGETNAALEFSKNPIQAATELWNQFKGIGLQIGDLLLPVICAGMSVLGDVLSGVAAVLDGVVGFFSGWAAYLREGSPLVWGLTAALGALTVALIAYEMWTNRAAIATKLKSVWDGVAAVVTGGWTTVQWALNAALYACPLVWIIALIAGLIAGIIALCTKVQGWGKQWEVIVTFAKNCWALFIEQFKYSWNQMSNGFMIGLDKIKLGWYKFKEAVGLGDSSENQAMIDKINEDVERRKQTIADGAKRIQELTEKTRNSLTWELSWKKGEKKEDGQTVPGTESKPGTVPAAGSFDFDVLMNKMGKAGGTKSGQKVLDLNETVKNNKGDTAYSAIASRFAMVKMAPSATSGMPSALLPGKQPAGTDWADYSGEGEKADFQKSMTGHVASIGKTLHRVQEIAATIAAVVTVGTAVPAVSSPLPTVPVVAAAPELPRFPERDQERENLSGRNPGVYLDKYCEQVVINVQNTDRRGTDEIRETIRETLTDIFDLYEA